MSQLGVIQFDNICRTQLGLSSSRLSSNSVRFLIDLVKFSFEIFDQQQYTLLDDYNTVLVGIMHLVSVTQSQRQNCGRVDC